MTPKKARASLIADIIGAARDGKLALFVGAGISRSSPTLIPLADSIKESLLRALTNRCSFRREYEWVAHLSSKRLAGLPLELVLDHVQEATGAGIALRLFDICRNRPPNRTHIVLVRLMSEYGANIVTTNQDAAIEAAARRFRIRVHSIVAATDVPHSTHAEHTLLKLHGSVLNRRSIAATLTRATQGLQSFKVRALRQSLRDKFVCFLGWSGRDTDISPLLSSCVTQGVWVLRPKHIGDTGSPSNRQASELARHLGLNTLECDIEALMLELVKRLRVSVPGVPHSSLELPPDLDAFCAEWARDISPDDAAVALSLSASYTERAVLLVEATKSNYAAIAKRRKRRSAALHRVAVACERAGLYSAARWYVGRALARARRENDRVQQGKCLGTLGSINHRTGRPQRAKRYLRAASRQAQLVKDWANWCTYRDRLGTLYAADDDYVRATKLYSEARDAAQRAGVAHRLIGISTNMGIALLKQDRVDDGLASLHRAVDLATSIGDSLHRAVAHYNLGYFHYKLFHDVARSERYLRKSITAFRKAGDRKWTGIAEAHLGWVMSKEGRTRDAKAFFIAALSSLEAMPKNQYYLIAKRGLRRMRRNRRV